MKIFHLKSQKEYQNRNIEINANSLSQTIFPYYSKESIQGSCREFIEGQEGLILSDTMAKQLQIETLTPETSIKMPVYVPTTMTLNNNLDGSKYIDIHYTVVDIDVNIVGILKPEHVFLFDSIGYLDTKFIAETIDSAQANVTVNENESLWKTNTYTLFMDQKNLDQVYDFVYDYNPNYYVYSIQSSTEQLLSDWLRMEQNTRYFTMMLLGCGTILIALYGVFMNKKNITLLHCLNTYFLNHESMKYFIKKELFQHFLILIMINIVGISIIMAYGFKTGLLILGSQILNKIIMSYLLVIGLSFYFVLISNIKLLYHVKRHQYD